MIRDLAARAAAEVTDELHDSLNDLSGEVGVELAAQIALATCVGAARAFRELRTRHDALCDPCAELNLALELTPCLN